MNSEELETLFSLNEDKLYNRLRFDTCHSHLCILCFRKQSCYLFDDVFPNYQGRLPSNRRTRAMTDTLVGEGMSDPDPPTQPQEGNSVLPPALYSLEHPLDLYYSIPHFTTFVPLPSHISVFVSVTHTHAQTRIHTHLPLSIVAH